MVEPLIKVEHLTKIFSDSLSEYKALDDISFTVQSSEILGISGPSGSGKTTLLSIIGCLEKPTSGSITLFGENVEKLDDKTLSNIRLNHIGFIFQEHNLIPALTVQENILLPLTLSKKDPKGNKKKVRELLEKVGLSQLEQRYPSQLSRGQRQRIAAIRALANDPKIILADEPISDLDPDNSEILLAFFKELNEKKGTTIIIGATKPEDFKGNTHRTIRLVEGRLV